MSIRVLAVDDSAVARTLYREVLTPERGFDLVATAPNADIGRRKIAALAPDVVVLDIDMPGEDGLTFLTWLMAHQPIPVIIASAFSPRGAEQTLRAFSLGAVDVVCKTAVSGEEAGQAFPAALISSLRAAAAARFKLPRAPRAEQRPAPVAPQRVNALTKSPGQRLRRQSHIVVIGASTGGTEVLAQLIRDMPPDFAPVFVVQHMPALYTRAFAQRLDTLGEPGVAEADNGSEATSGHVLVAPGGKQMRIVPGGTGPAARVTTEAAVNGHAPSVDVLFESAAEHYGRRVIGVLLTGMGDDGARGLLRIRQAGGHTIAQDEATSVVWGMPQAAIRLGGAEHVLAPGQMVGRILGWLNEA